MEMELRASSGLLKGPAGLRPGYAATGPESSHLGCGPEAGLLVLSLLSDLYTLSLDGRGPCPRILLGSPLTAVPGLLGP